MKIGIFGGSFNPPHNMHINIGKELLEKKYLDKIIFVPTGIKYEYKTNLLPNNHRYQMLKLLVTKNDKFSVSDYEFRDKVIYTYETLNYFKNKFPKDEIYFICGTDNFSYINKWKNGEYILNNYKIIIIKRKTDNLDLILEKYAKYKDNFLVANITPYDLSSTKIRDLIRLNSLKELNKYLDSDIIEYIIKNKLYL